MDKIITPKKLSGTVTVPPSKSQAHRAVIAACLSVGESVISNIVFSQDIAATVQAMVTFGAAATHRDGVLRVTGAMPQAPEGAVIDCSESGSTLRFLIPLAWVSGKKVTFTGRGRLMSRPLDPYFDLCDAEGIAYEKTDNAVTFCGKLKGGTYRLPGNISSQFITGLLFALPLLSADSRIELTTDVESVGYIQMTLDVLAGCGIAITHSDDFKTYEIRGNQHYLPKDLTVEGDYSQAAFYLCANAMGSRVDVQGLNPDSAQGDKEILSIINRFGEPLTAITIDASQIPDLVPVLAVLASQAEGETRIINAARLRIKESDRLATTRDLLSRLGAEVTETADALVIPGKARLRGGVVDAHNDHRIAMAAAIAATVAEGEVTILGAECVAKSYGNFWEHYERLAENAQNA